jgi:hypothetical protein
MQRRAAGVDVADRVRQRLWIHVFEQIPGRAGGDRREDLRVVGEAREHENADSRCDVKQPADGADPVALRHHQVEEHHVGGRRSCEADRLLGAARLADHLDAVLEAQKRAQALTHHRVVVDDEQPDDVGHRLTPPGRRR